MRWTQGTLFKETARQATKLMNFNNHSERKEGLSQQISWKLTMAEFCEFPLCLIKDNIYALFGEVIQLF